MSSKRFFVVLDIDDFDGDKHDAALWLDCAVTADWSVYDSLDDMLADSNEKTGAFEKKSSERA